jgi:glutamine---fructose-6-phosphate transaminase (isomerizing)
VNRLAAGDGGGARHLVSNLLKSPDLLQAGLETLIVEVRSAAQGSTLEVAELVTEIGGACFIVGNGASEAVDLLAVPEVPEPISALTCLLPLQLFAYHLALVRRTNPDSFRADDPRFARAGVSGRL